MLNPPRRARHCKTADLPDLAIPAKKRRMRERFVRRIGDHLQTGKPFPQFGGLRSREMLAKLVTVCCSVVHAPIKSPSAAILSPMTGLARTPAYALFDRRHYFGNYTDAPTYRRASEVLFTSFAALWLAAGAFLYHYHTSPRWIFPFHCVCVTISIVVTAWSPRAGLAPVFVTGMRFVGTSLGAIGAGTGQVFPKSAWGRAGWMSFLATDLEPFATVANAFAVAALFGASVRRQPGINRSSGSQLQVSH